MAFATVSSSSAGNSGGAAITSHTVTLPATVNADELLLVLFAIGHNATITWDDATVGAWSSLFNILDATSAVRYTARWLKAAGTEDGASLSISTGGTAAGSAWHAFAISGWHGTTGPEVATTDHGSTSGPNPASLSPSWGAEDTLWLATIGWDAPSGSPTVSAFPTDYLNGTSQRATATRGGGNAVARRELNAASEDAGAFTLSAAAAVISAMIAIRPAAGGGGGGSVLNSRLSLLGVGR
jgi:hypothetical protein